MHNLIFWWIFHSTFTLLRLFIAVPSIMIFRSIRVLISYSPINFRIWKERKSNLFLKEENPSYIFPSRMSTPATIWITFFSAILFYFTSSYRYHHSRYTIIQRSITIIATNKNANNRQEIMHCNADKSSYMVKYSALLTHMYILNDRLHE